LFSLNVPLPPGVPRLAAELRPELAAFDRVRERHTLVCKRFDEADLPDRGRERTVAELRSELRPLLRASDAFEVRIDSIDAFEEPATGPAPVVYLAVESPPLVRLHRRLCRAFGAVERIEGDDYVPHVTLARGGDPGAAAALRDRSIETIRWRVGELLVWDPEYREPAARLEL